MAEILALRSALAASDIDPIQLHAKAMNSLSCIMRELRAATTDYEVVNSHLASATEALGTLRIVDAHFTH